MDSEPRNLFDDLSEIAIDIVLALEEWQDARTAHNTPRIKRARAQIAFHQALYSAVLISTIVRRIENAERKNSRS